ELPAAELPFPINHVITYPFNIAFAILIIRSSKYLSIPFLPRQYAGSIPANGAIICNACSYVRSTSYSIHGSFPCLFHLRPGVPLATFRQVVTCTLFCHDGVDSITLPLPMYTPMCPGIHTASPGSILLKSVDTSLHSLIMPSALVSGTPLLLYFAPP